MQGILGPCCAVLVINGLSAGSGFAAATKAAQTCSHGIGMTFSYFPHYNPPSRQAPIVQIPFKKVMAHTRSPWEMPWILLRRRFALLQVPRGQMPRVKCSRFGDLVDGLVPAYGHHISLIVVAFL